MASSSSSTATGPAEKSGDFLGEVRTMFAENRKYYASTFPNAPKGEDGKTKLVYPEFGSKAFPTPVHMRVEEATQEISDGESDEDEAETGFRRFKKRRVYVTRKEPQWVLSDRKRKNVLYGEREGQTARYFCIMPPPPGTDQPFRMMPVHEWLAFKRAPNYKPLSASEAKAIQGSRSSMTKIAEYMEARQRKLEEEEELEGVIETTRGAAGAKTRRKQRADMGGDDVNYDIDLDNPEDLLLSDDDQETREKVGGRNGGIAVNMDDEDKGDDEEDVDVMAIDRVADDRGEGNGDADFEENFDDDDDDAGVMNEEEQQLANEATLIEGAEELRDALSDDDMDDGEGESDEEESDSEGEDGANSKDKERAAGQQADGAGSGDDVDRQMFLNDNYYQARANKVVKEGEAQDELSKKGEGQDQASREGGEQGARGKNKRTADVLSTPASRAQPKKRPRNPFEAFKDAVVEVVRSNGGTMPAKTLFNTMIKDKALRKRIGMTHKQQAKDAMVLIAPKCFDTTQDPITQEMMLALKPEFI